MDTAYSLAEVLARPDVWRGDRLAAADLPAVASGYPLLDAELPGGGWPRGALTEILSDCAGIGECALLLPALQRMRNEAKWVLLASPPQGVNAPAWGAAGVDLTRLAIVSPSRPQEGLWAAEQALASGVPGAVLCWAAITDVRQVRRLQVAAAGSSALMFLFRPARAQRESSPATLRLLLSPGVRGESSVQLLKRRGPPCGKRVMLDLPRPAKWRDPHASAYASALAGTASAPVAARSRHVPAAAW